MITLTKEMILTLQEVSDFAERQKCVYRVVKIAYMPTDECAFVVHVRFCHSNQQTKSRKMKVTYYDRKPKFEGWF